MKYFKCDICGISTQEFELHNLSDMDISNISDVCNSCYQEIRIIKSKIETVLNPLKDTWLRKLILKMKKF